MPTVSLPHSTVRVTHLFLLVDAVEGERLGRVPQLLQCEKALSDEVWCAAGVPVPADGADVPLVVAVTERGDRHGHPPPVGVQSPLQHLRSAHQHPLSLLCRLKQLQVRVRLAPEPVLLVQLSAAELEDRLLLGSEQLLGMDDEGGGRASTGGRPALQGEFRDARRHQLAQCALPPAEEVVLLDTGRIRVHVIDVKPAGQHGRIGDPVRGRCPGS